MARRQLLSELEKMRQQLHMLESCRQEMQSAQSKYERLLASAPDAMLFLSRDGRIVLSNAQLEKLFGYTEEELIGMDVHTLIPERYHAVHRRNVANYFSNPFPRPMGTDLEIYGLRKDKTEFPGDISLSPLETDGELLVIASIRDITERKMAEQQIEQNYRIQTVISSVLKVSLEPISLYEQLNRVLDLILTIPGVLPEAEGYIYVIDEDAETLILGAHRSTGPEPPPFERIATDKCVCQGFRLTCAPDAASCVPDRHFCVPIVSSGQMLGLIVIVMEERSITIAAADAETFLVAIANTLAAVIMRHQAEAERNRLRDQLSESEKLAALGRIAANVADEIRNPLTAVGGFARRLEKQFPNASKEKEYVAYIVAEVTRMEGILRSVLSLSRGATPRTEQCDLGHIAEEAVRLSEEACRERFIRIERVYGEIAPINCEKKSILQAIENLIINAVEAMPSGGTLTITTGKELVKGTPHAVLSVKDSGEGVKEEFLTRIFEPFFTTRVALKGVGLGLPLAKKFVEDHGGVITVKSDVGSGSTFSLYLPYNR